MLDYLLKHNIVACGIITAVIVLVGYAASVLIICHCDGNPSVFSYLYCSGLNSFVGFYASSMRGHLFTGFLSLGGFLLSLKTFIVVTMKDKLYDSVEYRNKFDELHKLDSSLRVYSPLKELSDILYHAILASIACALIQMTVGLYENLICSIFAIASAIYAMILLIFCLFLIKDNLNKWFDYLDASSNAGKDG